MSDHLIRTVVLSRLQRAIRKVADTDSDADYGDRLMIASVLVAGAIAVAWPAQRSAPKWIIRGAQVADGLWKRRSLWLDEDKTTHLSAVQ